MDADRYDYNYRLLPDAVNTDTLCVISGNLFGIPSDTERIIEACKGKGIYVVEDAAQAMGCRYKGRLIGTIADVGFYSLGRGKNITCGSGGIIVTNSDIIAYAVNTLYNQLAEPGFLENVRAFLETILLALFIHPSLYWFPAGLPFLKLGETIFYADFPVKRLSGMKAGMLRNWRRRLEEYNRIRRENAAYYRRAMPPESRPGAIAVTAVLRLPFIANNREIRDHIITILSRRGLGVSRLYPTPINMIEEIKSSFSEKEYPAARKLSDSLFTVPIHPLLRERERRAVCELLSGFAEVQNILAEEVPGS
jgi:dTDP-4-amino-4,6-dideoxygalactose transaminase